MTDILDEIDRATGCQECGGPLGASPSDDFCSEKCQIAWRAKRVGAEVAGPYEHYRQRFMAGPFDDGSTLPRQHWEMQNRINMMWLTRWYSTIPTTAPLSTE